MKRSLTLAFMLLTNSALAKPAKLAPTAAARVNFALVKFRLVEKQTNEAAQLLAEIEQTALQQLVDEINDIGQGLFTAEDIYTGQVHVNPKTGEVTRKPPQALPPKAVR